jgi:heme A synthase
MRGGAVTFLRSRKRKNNTDPMALHFIVFLVSTSVIGYLMVFAGLQKNVLELRRRRRICPSCGREIHGRTCSSH